MSYRISSDVYAQTYENMRRVGLTEQTEIQAMLELWKVTGNPRYKHLFDKAMQEDLWRVNVTETQDPFFLPDHELVKAGEGEIEIGSVIINEKVTEFPVRISLEDLERMTFIAGQTGSGKTSLIELIAIKVMGLGNNIKVWFFDAENKSHRIAQGRDDVLVLGVDRGLDRQNFLQPPPNQDLLPWVPTPLDIMAREFHLLDASISFQRDSTFDFIEELGGEIPSLPGLHSYIQSKFLGIKKGRSSRQVEWAASVVNRLSTVVSDLGKGIDCSEGFDFETLAQKSIVFQLRDLTSLAKNLYVKLMCLKLYHYQMNRETDDKYLIILDEAHLYLPRSGDYRDGTNFLVTLMWQARKRGIYFLTASPSPDAISKACLNAGVVSSFCQGGKAGIREIESPLLLNEDMQYEISQLPNRTAIIKTPHFPQPVRFQVSDFSPPELSQVDCDVMMQPQLSELFYDVVKVKPQAIPQQKSEGASGQKKDQPKSQSGKQTTEQATLVENEVHWLVEIYSNPWLLLKEHYKNLVGKMSQATAIKWKDKLIQKDYLKIIKVPGLPGRTPSFLVFDSEGELWLKKTYGDTASIKMQRGDVLHQFGIERVVMGAEGQVKKGNNASGVEADASIDGKICIEVVNSNFSIENLRNYLRYYAEVWVVFFHKDKLASSKKKAEREIKEGLEKVSWKMLKEFV